MAEQLPVVAWLHELTTETYREASITSFSETDPWVDALKDVGHAVLSSPLTPHAPAQSALDELRREVEALRADAERYRWLRAECEKHGGLTIAKEGSWELNPWSGDDPDRAIDTARASTDEGVGK